jgi:lysophospholipase L1-like esterase
MRSIDVTGPDAPVRLAGIVDLESGSMGATTQRLPAWARAQIVDPAITVVSAMPSGGRIEMITDSTAVEIDVLLTRLQFGPDVLWTPSFELVVDGEPVDHYETVEGNVILYSTRDASEFELIHGDPVTVRFAGLGNDTKRVDLWLPHNAAVTVRDLRVDGAATLERPAATARRWVHYGSSISHCMEADRPTGVWPAVAARLGGVDLTSLGLAGQCQLDQFTARTIRDLPADLVSLKLGINLVNADSMRERTFVPAVHGVLDTIRDGHPAAPIVVISPIVCPAVEEHPGPTLPTPEGSFVIVDRPLALATGALTLVRIRELLARVVEARRAAGDDRLHLLHGHDLFGPDDVGDLPDGLHPNAAGYRRMGERFASFAFGPDGPFA